MTNKSKEFSNVLITHQLFGKIYRFYEYVALTDLSIPGTLDFDGALLELRKKQNKINTRTAYINSIYARDDTQKHIAYMNYLRLKDKKY